jgi:hypothetical protein
VTYWASDLSDETGIAEFYYLSSAGQIRIDLDGARIDELRKLLSRGLNTWERAPEWLLKLAEIVG